MGEILKVGSVLEFWRIFGSILDQGIESKSITRSMMEWHLNHTLIYILILRLFCQTRILSSYIDLKSLWCQKFDTETLFL